MSNLNQVVVNAAVVVERDIAAILIPFNGSANLEYFDEEIDTIYGSPRFIKDGFLHDVYDEYDVASLTDAEIIMLYESYCTMKDSHCTYDPEEMSYDWGFPEEYERDLI